MLQRSIAFLDILLLLSASAAWSVTATIVTTDDNTVTGDLISHQDGVWRVRTAVLGKIPVPDSAVAKVTTSGGVAAPTLRLAGSTTVGDELAPSPVEAFENSRGSTTVTQTAWSRSAQLSPGRVGATGI